MPDKQERHGHNIVAKLELENVSYVYGAGTPFVITALKDINISLLIFKSTGTNISFAKTYKNVEVIYPINSFGAFSI